MGFVQKLKDRWKLSHNYQVWLILLVFACTGTTVMLLKPYVLVFFEDVNRVVFNIAYYILIFPVYNLILLIYGFVFGLFDFFWEFEKKTFNRIFRRKA
ncbi:MAG: DUF6787 family protein [Cyclobacteriaceae bacterium]